MSSPPTAATDGSMLPQAYCCRSPGVVVGLIMLRQRHDLVASRQALAVTLENMSQGIAMIDADGTIPFFTRRAVELLGLPDELVGPAMTYRQVVNWQLKSGEFSQEAAQAIARQHEPQPMDHPETEQTYERS